MCVRVCLFHSRLFYAMIMSSFPSADFIISAPEAMYSLCFFRPLHIGAHTAHHHKMYVLVVESIEQHRNKNIERERVCSPNV